MRLADDVVVLVNLDLVRIVEPIVGGVRLHFGNQPQDRLDVKALTIDGLKEQMDP